MTAATERTPLNGSRPTRYCSSALRVRIITSIISLAEGYDIGVVNGAVVLFKEELNLSTFQVGIVLSIFPLGVAICAPMAASLADCAGRKPTMILSSFCLVLGGLLMTFATRFEMLALGRLTAGSGVGIGITAVTAYMSEVSPAAHRGLFGSLEELFVNLGNVVGYLANLLLLGIANDWRVMLGLGIIPAVLVIIILALPYECTGIPESPRFLYKVGRKDEAREILLDLLDGDEEEADIALEMWNTEAVADQGMATWGQALTAFCTTKRRQAFAGIGCGILNMFTGIMLMMVTTTMLLVSAGMEKREAMMASIFIGLAKAVVMLVVAVFVLDTWGRRPLLLTSLLICTAATSLGVASTHYGYGNTWIITSLVLFVTGYSVGVGPVPWVYMPEVLDSRYRGKGCSLGLSGARLCAVTHLFWFPVVFPVIGIKGLFAFLVTVNILGFIFVATVCKETTGQSLERIPSLFEDCREEESGDSDHKGKMDPTISPGRRERKPSVGDSITLSPQCRVVVDPGTLYK